MARRLLHPFQPDQHARADHRGEALLQADGHGLALHRRGEVHDIFDLGDHLLVVATDRVGVNGVILQDGIPDKGTIANELSARWTGRVADLCPSHLAGNVDWPNELKHDRAWLEPRAAIVRKATVIPIECTVRGYLTRAAFEELLRTGTVGGKPAPGMLRSGRLPEPRLAPTRRASSGAGGGARERITRPQMVDELGADLTDQLEATSIAIYERAEQTALLTGVVIAQTTLRFGWIDDEVHLIGDCLTPDSSSYWTAEDRTPGAAPRRLGKGFLLEELGALGWDGSAPGPRIPDDVVARIRNHYVEAYARITGDHRHLTDRDDHPRTH